VRFSVARWVWIVSLDVSIKAALAWLISAITGFNFSFVFSFALILSALHLAALGIVGSFVRLLDWPRTLSRAMSVLIANLLFALTIVLYHTSLISSGRTTSCYGIELICSSVDGQFTSKGALEIAFVVSLLAAVNILPIGLTVLASRFVAEPRTADVQ
jgi:hypothetical protein